MSINQFRRSTKANNNDLFYIIDTSGNRPVTKLITTSNLLEDVQNNVEIPPSQPPLTLTTKSASLVVTGSGYQSASLALGNSFILTKVTSNLSNIRVRLYLNQTFANADINRAIGATLPTSHGLIYDAVFSGSTVSLDVLPSAIASTNQDSILVINNLLGSQQSISLIFTYIPLF
jgi:hypothetical protein